MSMADSPPGHDLSSRVNTIAMLGRAYSLLGFQIVDGVVGTGIPIKPKHSAVFAQIAPHGVRLTDLARGANISSQAMGELVDELEDLGYVRREPDPRDRRAKLVKLTQSGTRVVAAGRSVVADLESRIDEKLGHAGHRELRRLLTRLLED